MPVTANQKRVRFVSREPKGEPAWRAVHRAADANVGRLAATLPESIEVLRRGVDQRALRRALELNAPELAIQAFPWGEWARHLERLVLPKLKRTMAEAAEGAARNTVVHVAKQHSLEGAFDLINPRAQRVAALIGARYVTRITDMSRLSMREMIVDAMRSGRSLRDQADDLEGLLRSSAGLDRPRSLTLLRYAEGLRAQGLAPKTVEQRAAAMYGQLLRARAMTIARHETMVAANAGQEELWNQAEEKSLLPVGVPREWVNAPDHRLCPICDHLGGQKRRRGEAFSGPDGKHYEGPPAHVLCRCALVLALD